MAEIEDHVATDIAGKLDQGDESTAKPSASFSSMNAGTGTMDSIHSSSSTTPFEGSSMHGGSETQPLGDGWELPDDGEAFMRARAEVRASEAATAISLRQFARGYVAPSGAVAGLNKSTESERTE